MKNIAKLFGIIVFPAVIVRHGWRCLSALAGVFAKQKLLSILIAGTLLVCSACDEPGNTHTHSYSATWSYDATQHWHECTAGDGAKSDVANHSGNPCTDCGYDTSATPVTFSSVTANGSSTATTTTLTLTFSAAINGLSASDINLSGVSNVSKGTLSGTGPTYTLGISGFTTGGTLSVAVSKSGYNISGSPKTVPIHYYTSSSGGGPTNWTAVADDLFTDTQYQVTVYSITYGGGKFVAGGSMGKMAYSSDGVTWTAATKNNSFGSSLFQDIIYTGDKFYAVGSDMKMMYSGDGITWTDATKDIFNEFQLSSINRTNLQGIAYGGGKFVVVGYYSGYSSPNARMAYSTDGITWTSLIDDNKTIEAFSQSRSIYSITYGNGKFVIGGTQGNMAYSSDGENWTAVTDSTFGTNNINGIVYGNGKFVAVGSNRKIAYSSDGETWTAVPTANTGFTNVRIYNITYGNGYFVAVAEDSKLAYSTNAENWTLVSGMENIFASFEDIRCVAYGDGKFVIGGEGGKRAYANW